MPYLHILISILFTSSHLFQPRVKSFSEKIMLSTHDNTTSKNILQHSSRREKDIENRSWDEPEALFILSYHPSESIQPSLLFSLLHTWSIHIHLPAFPVFLICNPICTHSWAQNKQLGNMLLIYAHGLSVSARLKNCSPWVKNLNTTLSLQNLL